MFKRINLSRVRIFIKIHIPINNPLIIIGSKQMLMTRVAVSMRLSMCKFESMRVWLIGDIRNVRAGRLSEREYVFKKQIVFRDGVGRSVMEMGEFMEQLVMCASCFVVESWTWTFVLSVFFYYFEPFFLFWEGEAFF